MTRRLNRSAVYSLPTLPSLPSLYLSRCPRAPQAPFQLPSPSGSADCPKVLEPRGMARGFGDQTSVKVSPLLAALGHPGARTGYQGSTPRRGEAGQLLEPSAPVQCCLQPAHLWGVEELPSRRESRCPTRAAPAPSAFRRGISSGRGFAAGGTAGVGAAASPEAPFPGRATRTRSALLFQVVAARAREPEPPLLRRRPSYLTMQHLVARFPGALLPWGLFPYLGGKRNREAGGGPGLRSGRLPASAALSGRADSPSGRRGAGAAGRGQAAPGPAPARVSAAPKRCVPAARYYGTAAPRPWPLRESGCHSPAEPCPRAQSPPRTPARAHTHAPHTNRRARATHTRECGSARCYRESLWCKLGLRAFGALLSDRA